MKYLLQQILLWIGQQCVHSLHEIPIVLCQLCHLLTITVLRHKHHWFKNQLVLHNKLQSIVLFRNLQGYFCTFMNKIFGFSDKQVCFVWIGTITRCDYNNSSSFRSSSGGIGLELINKVFHIIRGNMLLVREFIGSGVNSCLGFISFNPYILQIWLETG